MGDVVGVQVKAKPQIFITVHLENHLEERSSLEELIADDVFQFGQNFEKLIVGEMRIAADILYSIDDLGFKFYQRLDCHFVDFFEGLPIDIFEVLGFEFFDQLGIGALHVGPSDCTVLIEPEMPVSEFFMQQFTELLLRDDVVVEEPLEDEFLLLFPGGVRSKENIHVEDMIKCNTRASLGVFSLAGSISFVFDVLVQEFMGFD